MARARSSFRAIAVIAALSLTACGGRPIGVMQPVADNIPGTSKVDLLVATTRLPDGQTMMTFVDVTESANYERMLTERNEAPGTAARPKDASSPASPTGWRRCWMPT